jgi:glyoxylate/hydroxypyruvate reductase
MLTKIVISINAETEAQRWHEALASRLPEIPVHNVHQLEISEREAASTVLAVGWKPKREFFSRYPNLLAFFNAGAGVDALLNHTGLPQKLEIFRVEDAGMGQQMALYCLQECLRRHNRTDDYASQQAQGIWRSFESRPLSATHVGIFGLGVLGKQIATRLSEVGFSVSGFSTSKKTIAGVETYTDDLSGFLNRCDVLILVAPLTEATDSLFNRATLAHLPRGAQVINVARGPLLIDEDLLTLLDAEHLAGATLDVFRKEPLPSDHPFWKHPKVRITPHSSAQTLLGPSVDQISGKIRQYLRGERPSGLVDRSLHY